MSELQILSKTADVVLGGETYTASKITLGIMADFATAMQMRRLKRALDALGDDARPQDRQELIKAMSYMHDPMADVHDMQTMDGMRLLLWLCLKPHNPSLDESAVGELIGLQDIGAVQEFINILSDQPLTENLTDPGNAETVTAADGQPSPQA